MKVFWYIVVLVSMLPTSVAGQNNQTLRVGIVAEPPFVIFSESASLTGLSIDLWQKIAAETDREYEFVRYNDHPGLLRALDFGEIDLTINPIHVTEMRLQMLEVTQPFFVSSIGVSTTTVEKSQLGIFLQNFFSLEFLRVVLLLVLIIFIFGTILWLVERHFNPDQFPPGWHGLFDGLWWSAVTMTTVGYGDKAPRSRLGRIIAMIWMFTAIIIISGFTATIASTLTIKSLATEVERVEDLQQVNGIGCVYGSSGELFLSGHGLVPDHLFDNPEDALLALANKETEVLLYDRTVLEYLINKLDLTGRISLLPVRFNKQYRSFFLPRGSEEADWLNPLVVRFINEAGWPDLLRKYNLHEE